MPSAAAETNGSVLLEQVRRYADAESGRRAGLQTNAAALLAAVLVLIGLTLTVASQFSSRDVPGWIWLVIAGFALAALAIGAVWFVLVLVPPQTVRGAPQVIRVLLTPGVADTDPGAFSLQLAGTLADELDVARSETERMNRRTLIGRLWLAAGVLGVFLLAGLFGVTHDVPTVQRVRLVAPLNARVIAPVQARIAAPVQARILAPLHVRIVGPVGAKIETPVRVVISPRILQSLRRRYR